MGGRGEGRGWGKQLGGVMEMEGLKGLQDTCPPRPLQAPE